MTFDQLCRSARATPEERDALAWHSAMIRAKKCYEELRYSPTNKAAQPGG